MTAEPSLLSLTIQFRPTETIVIHDGFGRAAHALLLKAIEAQDATLARTLHDSNGLRPFTVSGLSYAVHGRHLTPQNTCAIRFTTLSSTMAHYLHAAVQQGELKPGSTINFGEAVFVVENPSIDVEATTYEELFAKWHSTSNTPDRQIALRLVTPTTFKTNNSYLPFPLPRLTFDSLSNKWNCFAPLVLSGEIHSFAEAHVVISRYHLHTEPLRFKDGSLKIGAIGEIQYTVIDNNELIVRQLQLLADFAHYAGIGIGTSMGMGQCRRLEKNHI